MRRKEHNFKLHLCTSSSRAQKVSYVLACTVYIVRCTVYTNLKTNIT